MAGSALIVGNESSLQVVGFVENVIAKEMENEEEQITFYVHHQGKRYVILRLKKIAMKIKIRKISREFLFR